MGGINKFSNSQLASMIEVLGVGLSLSAGTLTSILSKDFVFSEGSGYVSEPEMVESEEFQPALAMIIENSGILTGSSVVLVKYIDVQNILSIFMNGDIVPDDNFELDELTFSTVKEIMSQAVSACAVQLSEFLGGEIDMSLSDVVIFESNDSFVSELGITDSSFIINYEFTVDELIGSEIMCVMPADLAEQFDARVNTSSDYAEDYSEDEYEQSYGGIYGGKKHGRSYANNVSVQSSQFPDFSKQVSSASKGLNGNMDILMDVPLNVSIEIGKTKKKMKEILEFGQGTIIALEKQAGAPVDVVVNGQLIARGDVVVIDDNFGVRITEVIGNANLINNEERGS